MEKHTYRVSAIATFAMYFLLTLFPSLRSRFAQSLADLAFAGKLPRGLFPLVGDLEFINSKQEKFFVDTRQSRLHGRLLGEGLVSEFFSRCINIPSHDGMDLLYCQSRFWLVKESVLVKKEGLKFKIEILYTYQILDQELAQALSKIETELEGTIVMDEPMPVHIIESASGDGLQAVPQEPKTIKIPSTMKTSNFIKYTGRDARKRAQELSLPSSTKIQFIHEVNGDVIELVYVPFNHDKNHDYMEINSLVGKLPKHQGRIWEMRFEERCIRFMSKVEDPGSITQFRIRGKVWSTRHSLPSLPPGCNWVATSGDAEVDYFLEFIRIEEVLIVEQLARTNNSLPYNLRRLHFGQNDTIYSF